MNEALMASGAEAKLPSGPALTCRLRPREMIGREGAVPNMGEVELENCSGGVLEIEHTMTPLQFFDLEVVGPGGQVVSEGHFSDRFSPTRKPAVLRLTPGEKVAFTVSLLATVPRERRVPGKYTIRGSYRFQGIRIQAEPLTIELTGPCCDEKVPGTDTGVGS
jgi:hypothetical protein